MGRSVSPHFSLESDMSWPLKISILASGMVSATFCSYNFCLLTHISHMFNRDPHHNGYMCSWKRSACSVWTSNRQKTRPRKNLNLPTARRSPIPQGEDLHILALKRCVHLYTEEERDAVNPSSLLLPPLPPLPTPSFSCFRPSGPSHSIFPCSLFQGLHYGRERGA